VYVNTDEILEAADRHIRERAPETTVFEGAATSDPMSVEEYTGSVARAVAFFASRPHGRFRLATKYCAVEGILDVVHRRRTRVRFSINTDRAIAQFERGTPALEERLAAARKVAGAGYPVGFLVAPVIAYPGWQGEYRSLVRGLVGSVQERAEPDLTFEVISHRFTRRAKSLICGRHPDSALPMNEGERCPVRGRFGYVKFVYPKAVIDSMKSLFEEEIRRCFPAAAIEYVI
jgi:spore photoproduct lyase